MNFEIALVLLPGLVVGITLHEFAHAWAASLLGDDYPRRRGRVSLNPLRHLAPLGTLAIFVLPFGWGRPVPVNLYNFRRPKRDYLLCSLAGPAANVMVVVVCLLLMLLTRHCYALGPAGCPFLALGHRMLTVVALINTMLAAINLLPIPPLDGSKIWPCLLPGLKPTYGSGAAGLFVILLLVLMWTGSIGKVVGVVLNGLLKVMPVSDKVAFESSFDRGLSSYGLQQYAEAEKLFSGALKVNPWSHESFYRRALCRRELGKLEDALADMDRAIHLSGRRARYYQERARLYELLGRPAEARADRALAGKIRADSPARSTPSTAPAP